MPERVPVFNGDRDHKEGKAVASASSRLSRLTRIVKKGDHVRARVDRCVASRGGWKGLAASTAPLVCDDAPNSVLTQGKVRGM